MGVLLKFGLLGSVSAGLRFGTATDLWAGFYSSAALLGVPCIAQGGGLSGNMRRGLRFMKSADLQS